MRTVDAAYARAHLSELLQHVANGERIIIQRHKRAVAELGPPGPDHRPVPKFGTGKGRVKIIDPNWADQMTDEEADAFIEGRY